MREIIIDGALIKDRESLHAAHRVGLSFPDYYGRNLDALYDCLTDMPYEARIVIVNFAELKENLGKYASAYRRVLCDAAARNERLHLNI